MQTPEEKAPETQNVNKEVVQMNMDEAIDNVRQKAYWFYWIAGLSLINTFLAAKGMIFIAGLAAAQIIDSVFIELTGDVNYIASLLAPIAFIVLGYFAAKLNRWAFIVGGIFYLLDGFIYLAFQEWLAAGFHGFVLYKLYQGYKAITEYEEESLKLN